MPNRVIRDDLLDSDRIRSLPTDSHRMLFVELLLLADDYGTPPIRPYLSAEPRRATAKSTTSSRVCSTRWPNKAWLLCTKLHAIDMSSFRGFATGRAEESRDILCPQNRSPVKSTSW